MASLNGQAFVNALQSEKITFFVGPNRKRVQIPKKILSLKSASLASLAEENNGIINLSEEESMPIDMFTCWCYKDRLPGIDVDETKDQRKERKAALLSLWLFAHRHSIHKLQNLVMANLLLIFNTPHLLTKRDIRSIWDRTKSHTTSPLRHLSALLIVVQIEEGNGEHTKTIDDFANLEGLEGLMGLLYKALLRWVEFEMPKMAKKDRRTKWAMFVGQKQMREALMERDRPEGTSRGGRAEVIQIDD